MRCSLPYLSAKRSFLNGHYGNAVQTLSETQFNDLSFDLMATFKANIFIARLLRDQANLDEADAFNTLSLLQGISSFSVRSSAIATFTRNLAIYQLNRSEHSSSLRYAELSQDALRSDQNLELVASIHLARQQFDFPTPLPFFRIWRSYFHSEYDSILQLSGELPNARFTPYLRAIAFYGLRRYEQAVENLNQSMANRFRISESLNLVGISLFYLQQIKDSAASFERAIRSTISIPEAVLNLAQLCGFLGKTYEQRTFLQYYARLQRLNQSASLSTLYMLAQLTLMEGNSQSAVDQYQFIADESVACGVDLPSDTFLMEFGHALNQTGDWKRAKSVFGSGEKPNGDIGRLVAGHTLWLEGKYAECREMIDRIGCGEAMANRGILAFLAGNDADGIRQMQAARRFAPNDLAITKNTVLMMFAKEENVKSACSIWLTALNYQLDHEPEYYEELINALKVSGELDPVTFCALTNWRNWLADPGFRPG
jgi:tetratricopeptide (TPR) repeat protein